MKERRKKKKNLEYVLRHKKRVKIYSLGLGSDGASDPTRRCWAGALNNWAPACLTHHLGSGAVRCFENRSKNMCS